MKPARVGSVLLLLLLGAATGCGRYYWSKPGATAEQFAQDNQTCLQQAARALPAGAAPEAIEQYYRACLTSRGNVRDKQVDPPPPGSYRGIEDSEEFETAAQARGPRQSFEQELAQLDELPPGRRRGPPCGPSRSRSGGMDRSCEAPAPARTTCPARWSSGGIAPESIDLLE
jgi:hypothetical protein